MNEFDDLDQLEQEFGPSLRRALRSLAAGITDDGSTSSLGLNGDGPDDLDQLTRRSTTVMMIDTEPNPTGPVTRRRWPILAVAAAVVAIVVVGVVLVARDDGSDPQIPAATTVGPQTAAAPTEFTACVLNGPAVTPGTNEQTAVSLPDGEMTIIREHGAWQLEVSEVTDPRLRGTWILTADFDHYRPSGSADTEIVSGTYRIEDDEGAWQGSDAFLRSDDEFWDLALIGEGAYEGFTAIMNAHQDQAPCPNTKGFIFEGSVPPPPIPNPGE